MSEPMRQPGPVTAAPAPAPAPAPTAPARRHLRVVNAPRRAERRRRGRVRLAMVAAALITIAFALVYLHVVMAQRQFRLDDVTAKVSADQQRYQQLRLQVAQLEAPSRIISDAEGRLGMREPSSVTYLTPAGTSAAPPTTVAPTQAPSGDADWPQIKSLLAGSP